jgi:4'-phosphopantetheinyl transferase
LEPPARLRLAGFPAEKRRVDFLTGRYAAKRAAAELAGERPLQGIEVRSGAFGQPVLGLAGFGVTISHARGLSIAFSFPEEAPLGADVEAVSEDRADAVRSQCTPGELSLAGGRAEELFRLWCLKEALSKALRCGLAAPFALLETVSVEPSRGGLLSKFGRFPFQGLSWVEDGMALAVVFPECVAAELDGRMLLEVRSPVFHGGSHV